MSNSESTTRISDRSASAAPELDRLAGATPNRRLRVVAVEPDHEAALAQEGLRVGVEIALERRLGLGGPLIVRLGRTRLALARSVAATIHVAPVCPAVEFGAEA